MVQAYAKESSRHGVTLVLRGIPDDYDTLMQFFQQWIYPLTLQSPTLRLQIDPRLWDHYDVTVVPTLVESIDTTPLCHQSILENGLFENRSFRYRRCRPGSDKLYWKVVGATPIDHGVELIQKERQR